MIHADGRERLCFYCSGTTGPLSDPAAAVMTTPLLTRVRVTVSSSSVTPPTSPSHSLPQPAFLTSRRSALLLLIASTSHPYSARAAASPFDKYVKRKKLEPLEAYVPAVLLSQDQFKDLEKSLEIEQPRYDESRSLLRSGPAASLRVNIRAVAQYANDSGKGKAASDAVDQCLRALEDLDSLLLHASRKDPGASVESMKGKITVAIGALDCLLQTVPSAILDKGKAIADAYRTPADEEETNMIEQIDPEIRRLEAIL